MSLLNRKQERSRESKLPIEAISETKYYINEGAVYSFDSSGIIKVISGSFNLHGFDIKPLSLITYNYVENYPIFKQNSTNISEIEIAPNSKFIYNNPKAFKEMSSVPSKITNYNNYHDASAIFVTGKKNTGKSTFIPYIINRILSLNRNTLYLECDTIHSYLGFPSCITLAKIKSPIFTNLPLLPKVNYEIIKSCYIYDKYDIQSMYDCLTDFFKVISDTLDKGGVVINAFSHYEPNVLIYNHFIEDNIKILKGRINVFDIKNKYIKDEIEENIDFIKGFYEDKIGKNEKNSEYIEIENNYNYKEDETNEDISLSEKKKDQELDAYRYFFDNENSGIIKINFSQVSLFYNCTYLSSDEMIKQEICKMYVNKFCVVLHNSTHKNVRGDINILNKINFQENFAISFCKISSFDFSSKKLGIFTNICTLSENDDVILVEDRNIEKTIKVSKNETFLNYLSNLSFKYNILTNRILDNKVPYLSQNSYSIEKLNN